MSLLVHRADAAAFVLGAVTPVERAAFERLIEREPQVAREVAAYARVAALLALVAPPSQPPSELRARILEAAAVGR